MRCGAIVSSDRDKDHSDKKQCRRLRFFWEGSAVTVALEILDRFGIRNLQLIKLCQPKPSRSALPFFFLFFHIELTYTRPITAGVLFSLPWNASDFRISQSESVGGSLPENRLNNPYPRSGILHTFRDGLGSRGSFVSSSGRDLAKFYKILLDAIVDRSGRARLVRLGGELFCTILKYRSAFALKKVYIARGLWRNPFALRVGGTANQLQLRLRRKGRIRGWPGGFHASDRTEEMLCRMDSLRQKWKANSKVKMMSFLISRRRYLPILFTFFMWMKRIGSEMWVITDGVRKRTRSG